MSTTRRSTRAASRVSSAVSDAPSTTARRSTRRTPSVVDAPRPRITLNFTSNRDPSLPTLNLRTSTAYGTNSTTQPTFMQGPETQDQINTVLGSILEPVREVATPGNTAAPHDGTSSVASGKSRRRGGSSVAAAPSQPIEKSFGHESSLFGNAGVDSSSYMGHDAVDPNSKSPAASQKADPSVELQLPLVTEIAQKTRVEHAPQEPEPAPVVALLPVRFVSYVSQFLSDVAAEIGEIFSALIARVILILSWIQNAILVNPGKTTMVVIAIAIALFSTLTPIDLHRPIRWYGTLDLSHNLGQFVPYPLSHPLSVFKDGDIQDLEKRLTAAEYDIAHLKTRANVDGEAISILQEILPDTIVCQRDENGNLQIPDNFWHALRDKIRSDNALLEERFARTESGTGLPKEEVIDIAQKQAEEVINKSNAKNWEKFLHTNRAQIKSWTGEEFDNQTANLRKDVLTSKSEFMTLIEQNWADTKQAILNEVGPQRKALDLLRVQISKLEKKAIGANREEIRAIATDVSKNLIFSAQFAPLADAQVKSSAQRALLQVNHFSLGTGASINARTTSSNYISPSMEKLSLLSKALIWWSHQPIPRPNPPASALTRWEEHGDCWCSPLNSDDGKFIDLGVLTSNKIYPEQVIVEHIPTTASLTPGAAPREMELWAFIQDSATRDAVESLSTGFYEEEKNADGMVKISTWTYDTESMENIQSFPLQLDLTRYGPRAYSNNFMVRVKSNWGGSQIGYACLYRVRLNGKIVDPEVEA